MSSSPTCQPFKWQDNFNGRQKKVHHLPSQKVARKITMKNVYAKFYFLLFEHTKLSNDETRFFTNQKQFDHLKADQLD